MWALHRGGERQTNDTAAFRPPLQTALETDSLPRSLWYHRFLSGSSRHFVVRTFARWGLGRQRLPNELSFRQVGRPGTLWVPPYLAEKRILGGTTSLQTSQKRES